jgi:YD repeat-containing protein
MTYDGNGNMTDSRAFNSKSTSYIYDALDRLTNILLPDAGDGQGTIATTLVPNINDDNTAVTDGKNNTTNNVYDGGAFS